MPYNAGATKAMNAMKKTYGRNWAHVYYGLANKRAGKGLRGKHRGHLAANSAYAKGSHWGGRGSGIKSGNARRSSGTRSRGTHMRGKTRLTVHTRGRANVNRHMGSARVRVRVL